MRVQINPLSILFVLLGIGFSIAALDFTLQAFLATNIFDAPNLLTKFFNMDYERNFPTLYSALLLLSAALLVFIITLQEFRENKMLAIYWLALAMLFSFMFMDELLEIHEQVNGLIREQTGIGQIASSGNRWDVLSLAIAFVCGIAFLPFLIRLPKPVAFSFITGGCLFVIGAIGIEFASAYFDLSVYYQRDFQSHLVTIAEELLEIFGVTIFIYGCLAYLGQRHADIHIHIDHASSNETSSVQPNLRVLPASGSKVQATNHKIQAA